MSNSIKKVSQKSVVKKSNEKEPDVIGNIENTMKYIVKKLSTGESNPEIRIKSNQLIFTSNTCPESNKSLIEIGYNVRGEYLIIKSSFNCGDDDKVSLKKLIPLFNGSKSNISIKKDIIELEYTVEKPNNESSRKRINSILNNINELFLAPVTENSSPDVSDEITVQ